MLSELASVGCERLPWLVCLMDRGKDDLFVTELARLIEVDVLARKMDVWRTLVGHIRLIMKRLLLRLQLFCS